FFFFFFFFLVLLLLSAASSFSRPFKKIREMASISEKVEDDVGKKSGVMCAQSRNSQIGGDNVIGTVMNEGKYPSEKKEDMPGENRRRTLSPKASRMLGRRGPQMSFSMKSVSSSFDRFSKTLGMKEAVMQYRRKLHEALGSLREDSDAPPALRRLALADEDDDIYESSLHQSEDKEEEEEEEQSAQDEHKLSGLGAPTTAAPSPIDDNIMRRANKPDEMARVCYIVCHENVEPSLGFQNDGEYGRSGDSFGKQNVETLSFSSESTLFPKFSRAFPSSTSSRRLLGQGVARMTGRGFALSKRDSKDSPEQKIPPNRSVVGKFSLDAPCREKSDGSILQGPSGPGGGGGMVGACPSLSPSGATEIFARSTSALFVKPIDALKPGCFAASYPRAGKPERSQKNAAKDDVALKKTDLNETPCKVRSDKTLPPEAQHVKVISSNSRKTHQREKTCESDSCFSLSTPRQQSTGSLVHFSLNTPQVPRQNILRSPRAQEQRRRRYQHSRVFSFSRVSSERSPRSPGAGTRIRPLCCESLEWIHHQLRQQGHVGHMPVFLSGSVTGEAGESGAALLPTRHSSQLEENSISSLILTCATSNVDTLRTFYDAPLDTFMESSTFTVNGMTSPL
ncbi:hypothetical protein MOQ_003112, partial [Trypanosoma cruzi marinkellei]